MIWIDGKYADKALEVAYESDITVYDASYIALAKIKDTYMYTADKKLIKRLKKEYLKYVKNIKDI